MNWITEEKKRLEDAVGGFGVEVGRCRCRECAANGKYDKYGPFHFYYAGRCLGYVLNGIYNSYYNRSIRLDEEKFEEELAELLKLDIAKI